MTVAMAIDVSLQTEYWRSGSEEDMRAAGVLLERGMIRQGLFFAHLSLEKMLKALVVRATAGTPPRTHDLLRLAAEARLALPEPRRAVLARIQQYCLEGRYPDPQPLALSAQAAEGEVAAAQEALTWLRSLLS